MAVNKGKTVFAGNELPRGFENARRVGLGGTAVVPVFGDTHLHFESYAFFRSTVDVRNAACIGEMGELLRAYIKKYPRTKLLSAFGCSAHSVAEEL